MLKLQCINNEHIEWKLTVGKIYEGEYGIWCLPYLHQVEGKNVMFCPTHGTQCYEGYKLVDDTDGIGIYDKDIFEIVQSDQ